MYFLRNFYTIISLALLLGTGACKEHDSDIEYRYANRPQVINCDGNDTALLNEALYSFEHDIEASYDPDDRRTPYAYARFVMKGLKGTAKYYRDVSPHSKALFEALVAQGIILPEITAASHLNYEHPLVNCIISNIEDTQIKRTIQALIKSNTMNPALLDSRFANKGRDLAVQRYLAMYLALDGYYQQLVEVDFTRKDALVQKEKTKTP